MLSHGYRLKKTQDIELVYKQGKSSFDPVCGIKFRKNGLKVSRFAVVVGLKVSKKAVVRNRLKRQYRALLREMLPRLVGGYDVMLLVSKPALDSSYEELRTKFLHVVKKAGLYESL
ncbi:MAG: ribonuclease P protein component [bacterium]|nr:ribonuclease P protein component [bacterium]